MNVRNGFLAAVALALAAQAAAEDEAPAAEAAAPLAASDERPAVDHLELDPTSIIGNRELPKVLVIVPWKRADLGTLEGKPANSLVNEVLGPVDRDVFRREIRYFEALSAKPGT